jgi:hypothetical protein
MPTALSLTDAQLRLVMTAARPLPHDKRDVFLQRLTACLGQVGYRRVGDADVESAVLKSLKGLLHEPVA